MALFHDGGDYARYQTRVQQVLEDSGITYLAYAWMPNHTHAVHVSGEKPALSRAMQRINGAYASGFNRRHGRVGYVFDRRFNSRLVIDERGMLALISYVLLNPLRGSVVRDLGELCRYPWTALPTLLGNANSPFVDSGRVLRMFSDDAATARRELLRLLAADAREEFSWGRLEVFAFDDDPAEIVGPVQDPRALLRDAGAVPTRDWARRQGSARLEAELLRVCADAGVDPLDLLRGRRFSAVVRIRTLLVHHGFYELRLPQSVIARTLKVSRTCVSRLLERCPGGVLASVSAQI